MGASGQDAGLAVTLYTGAGGAGVQGLITIKNKGLRQEADLQTSRTHAPPSQGHKNKKGTVLDDSFRM